MIAFHKIVRALAVAFAVFLSVSIVGALLGAVGLFGLGGETVLEESKTYSVTGEIKQLRVELNGAEFTVKEGPAFSVESNLKHLSVEEKDGSLTLRDTKKTAKNYENAYLTLYLPEHTELDRAQITTGAGTFTANALNVGTLKLVLGAGEVTLTDLTVTERAEIEGGAGKITVENSSLHNLDLEMGVGNLSLTAALTGKSELELGIGKAQVTVLGDRKDYGLEIEKGIGKIRLDGQEISHIREGSGDNRIELHGGIGNVDLSFVSRAK